MRRRFSYANVVATFALVFAMSGGALAAKHYLINSTKQINPKVMKALKGNKGAAGPFGATGKEGPPGKEGAAGKEGKEGAVGKEGVAGKEGAPGKEGKEGKEGPPGPTNLSTLEVVKGPFAETKHVALFDVAGSVAECPAGSHAISGGAEVTEADKVESETTEAVVKEGQLTGWEVVAFYSELKGGVKAVAYCAKEGSAVEASRASPAEQRGRSEAFIRRAVQRRVARTHSATRAGTR